MKNIHLLNILFTLIAAASLGILSTQSSASTAHTPPRTIRGIVTNSEGSAIQGAFVKEANGQHSTHTDSAGGFQLQLTLGDHSTLNIDATGYESAHVRVGTQKFLHIKLSYVAPETVEEQVVVEYAPQQSTSLVGNKYRVSTAEVRGCDIQASDYDHANTESYDHHAQNRFQSVANHPLSTFSLDVDGASYSNLRRMINQGALPQPDAVRVEEMVNYFSYDYPTPKGEDPVSISTEAGVCPWNTAHRLVRIGIKAREMDTKTLPVSNFVFLIDVSGSMSGHQRLGLVVASMKLLANNLRPEDKVTIVTYANSSNVALPTTSGSDKLKIRDALDNLHAGGSTAGGEGIQTAYRMARQSFIKGGNNRIILCTDGDFNVGVSSNEELETLITQQRQSGVFLSILGYGMGNYKDSKLQTLAEKGNGNHSYIDNLQEANRVLVNEFGSSLFTAAKDVKLQVEFNPAKVQSYRLIGYESRLLHDEDFNDDHTDAGELGAGHTVTALYEVVPIGVKGAIPGSVDTLKYQP